MKKILLSLFALMMVMGASAQNRIGYGPKVGLNIGMLTDKAFDARYNFNVGAFVEYDLSAPWSIELSAIYSRQGGTMKHFPVTLTENREATLRLDYINLPVVAKFYPWMGMNIFLGPQFSFLTNSQTKVKDIDAVNLKDTFQKFDIGAVGGIGYTWEWGMMISAQYNFGLRPLYKNKELKKVYNNVVQINVGWRF